MDSSASRRFRDLRVFVDTRVLIQALGYQGEAARIAVGEMFATLRQTGARLAVFEGTVQEIKNLFYLYQKQLATSQGRESLYPNDLTRYFLTKRYAPSDVATCIALLDKQIQQLGLPIQPTPKRIPRYTLDEQDLAQRLAKGDNPELEPRVWHDVECIAAILTLRRGYATDDIDNAKAVFITSTGLVVKHATEWFRAQFEGEEFKGKAERFVQPVIHHLALSNVAWLKRPASGGNLKLRELVALCTAALRPSRIIWNQFLQHLRKLRDSGEISSDETIAILANHLTDVHLSDMEFDDADMDADSLNDIVQRVQATYAAEANTQALKAKEAEQARSSLELRVQQQAAKIARLTSKSILLLVAVFVVAVVCLSLPQGILPWSTPLSRLAQSFLALLTILNLLFGVYVFKQRDKLEACLALWLRRWLLGAE